MHYRTILACVALSFAFGSAKPACAAPEPLTDQQRVEAITDAYGLGCAVQDRDIDRASAWASAAMGRAAALEAVKSHDASVAFGGYFYAAGKEAKMKGGFNCDGVPKWPTQ